MDLAARREPGESAQVKQRVGENRPLFKLISLYIIRRLPENQPAMNKAELVEAVQKSLGKDATKRAAEEAVSAVLDSIAAGVKKHKKVQIIGFGTFEVKKRAARMGRNPKTGESMKIGASKSVGFKPSSTLKASL
jgi:DNA-binding protein HU-beta